MYTKRRTLDFVVPNEDDLFTLINFIENHLVVQKKKQMKKLKIDPKLIAKVQPTPISNYHLDNYS